MKKTTQTQVYRKMSILSVSLFIQTGLFSFRYMEKKLNLSSIQQKQKKMTARLLQLRIPFGFTYCTKVPRRTN